MIEIALVRHKGVDKAYVFEVPSGAYLHKGDIVLVDTKYGEQQGEIVVEPRYIHNEDDKEFIKETTGCEFPLKRITAKVEIRRYEEANSDE